jgi:putative membrane protein
MKVKALLFAFALVIPTLAVADDMAKKDQKAEKTQLNEADKTVIGYVHHVNVMEIDMGKLAEKNGTAPVKKYGAMLIKDHSQSDKDLTALAKKQGLAKLPPYVPTNDAEKAEHKTQMEAMANLKKIKGADFDREFLRMMVEGHEKELTKSDAFIASTSDPALKTFLETRKTSLQRHADAAKELQKGQAQAVK